MGRSCRSVVFFFGFSAVAGEVGVTPFLFFLGSLFVDRTKGAVKFLALFPALSFCLRGDRASSDPLLAPAALPPFFVFPGLPSPAEPCLETAPASRT